MSPLPSPFSSPSDGLRRRGGWQEASLQRMELGGGTGLGVVLARCRQRRRRRCFGNPSRPPARRCCSSSRPSDCRRCSGPQGPTTALALERPPPPRTSPAHCCCRSSSRPLQTTEGEVEGGRKRKREKGEKGRMKKERRERRLHVGPTIFFCVDVKWVPYIFFSSNTT